MERSLAFAWEQWAQLGVSGHRPASPERRVADPEALLLFTLELAREDPRLFDEALDWLALNERLVSAQRLANLCSDETDRRLAGAALDWALAQGGRARRPGRSHATAQPEPLFPALPPVGAGQCDEVFARHGLIRLPTTRSGKSLEPALLEPIAFALRMRVLCGIGARAEVLRALLTIRAHRLSVSMVSDAAGFSERNVREALGQLHNAGVVQLVEMPNGRHYTIDHSAWAQALGLGSAPMFPFYHDWAATLRALTHVIRFLRKPGLQELSPYLRASQARTLVDSLQAEIAKARVPLVLYRRSGADYWDDFTNIALLIVKDVEPPK